MERNPECIFCKIVAGEIPCLKIAETEKSIAILDAFPLAPAHSLVISKRHARDYFDMTQEEVDDAARLLKRVGEAAMKASGATAVNLISNIGRPAGQVVMHAHLHAIPRFENDRISITFDGSPQLSEAEKSSILESIKSFL